MLIIPASIYSPVILTIVVFLTILVFFWYLLANSPWGRAKIEKLKIYWEVRPYLNEGKSINHSAALLSKYVLQLDFKKGESEMETFLDVKDSVGHKYPFMRKVKNSRDQNISVEGKPCKCISSYNYLDLGRDERVNKAAIDAAENYSTGNHGPRMLCGNLQILEDLEIQIGSFFKREHALVFSSGYLACMSTIAGIARKGDLILMDKLNHASLRAGTKLSGALVRNFKHNDFKDAEKIIKKTKYRQLIIVIEGIYSMDGDIGDLPAARKLSDKYGAILIMDEAHSLGTIGKTGHGCEEHFNYEYKADIICGTFSKSLSSVGGFLTCGTRLRDFYTFYAPGAVFSAPLSAYHAGAAMKSFEIIEKEPWRTEQCQKNGEYLREKFVENGFDIERSETCVIPVVLRDVKQLMNMNYYMLSQGYFSAAVMAPACSVEAPRFRICATSSETKDDIDKIINIFIEAREKFPESERITKLVQAIK
eukprot:CAMPEP_0170518482 /NCGR_PEP_ID=MMETSP0209-20121228/4160_1 /TAXON_ID=665100 ORGANISM="Litonotus pictus, Strain P1" /NCGR_SAMPLE_ID=MMETSP0209 /ASSEMBLY_ACC=CAM_ASM_000301 /LENGTH=477 /DNA_ID=CAMNT_0010804057 /DNA_START=132 /DNA_END=1565 /DNA_ORIENTATION=+